MPTNTGYSINAAKDFSTPHGLTAFSTFVRLYELSLDPIEIRESARRILASSARAQAIFAASNIAAKGVIPAIQSVGLRIPEDIALLVMDDFEALSLLNPAISVVAQPSSQIADVGWRMLRQLIAGEELEAMHVRLPAKLIVRGSTPPVYNGRRT